MSTEPMNHQESYDCLPCRLISGGGLIGAGAYVIRAAKNRPQRAEKIIICLLGSGLISLGMARWFDLPPFQHNQQKNWK